MGRDMLKFRNYPDETFKKIDERTFDKLETTSFRNFLVLKKDGQLYLSEDKKLINYFDHCSRHLCNKCKHFYGWTCKKLASGIIPLKCVTFGYICRVGTQTFHGVIDCRSFVLMQNILTPRNKDFDIQALKRWKEFLDS